VKKIDQQRRDDLKAVMGKLDTFLERSEWFGGEELSLADIAFLANVGTVKVRKIYLPR
jgi:glutathione S-transferase